MLVTSEVTGKTYDPTKTVRILNPIQSCLYMKARCLPVDVYPSIDFKTGKDVLVFLFDREQSRPLYTKWLNHEL